MIVNELTPYIGPRPFERMKADQEKFFGRNYESNQIVARIFANQIVLIYGASGVGKTSILNGQIIPILENQFEVLSVARPDPRGVPIKLTLDDNLYIFNLLQSLKPDIDPDMLINKSFYQFLHDYFPSKVDKLGRRIPLVIILDQLEKLFQFYSAGTREQREDFFIQVAEALNRDPDLGVVFVIREAYLAELESFATTLPGKLKTRFRLEGLRRNAAIEAVKGPLERAMAFVDDKSVIDKLFDEGIVDTLIEDLLKLKVEEFGGQYRLIKGEFVEPIQLQVVCQRLWDKLKTSQVDQINQDHFRYSGDVDEALKVFYESATYQASKQTGVPENFIRNWIEQKLITSKGTRDIVHREHESTGGIPNTVVDILENNYLIRKEEHSGAQWYELTNDRLIRPIQDSNEAWRRHRRRKGFRKYFTFGNPS
jgi:energy-coupling factor transporter ATP-binding protein EcfA2